MADSFSVEAILSAVDRNFSGTFKNISDSVSKAGNSFENSTKPLGGFTSAVAKIASAIGVTKIIGASFDAVKDSVSGAVSRFDTLNKYPVVMKALGYSASDVARSTKTLSDGIDGLPTSLDEVSKSAQQLAPLTGGANKAAESAIALNNAFLASGASTADASRGLEQYTQMLATGKVDLMSWRTLEETMPIALRKTANAFGFTGKSAENDLFKALQSGQITMDQLNNKFIELNKGQNGFASLAKKNSAGIGTSFANLKTAVVKGLANMLTAIDTGLQNSGLPKMAVMIDSLKGAINSAFGMMNKAVSSAIPAILSALKPFSVLILNIKTQLGNLGKGDSMSGLSSVLQGVGSILKTILSSLASIVNVAFVNLIGIAQKVGDAFNSAFGNGQMSGAFNGIKQAVTDFGVAAMEAMTTVGDFIANLPWKAIFDGVKGALSGVMAVLKPIAAIVKAAFANDIVKSFAAAIFGAVGAFKVIGLAIGGFSSVLGVFSKMIGPIRGVISVITNFGTIVKTAGGVWKAFGLILGMNPWALLIAGIAAVVAGLVYFFTQTKTGQKLWSGFVSWLQGAWQGLVGVAQAVWNAISGAFTSAISGIQTAWGGITDFFSNLWTGITTTASAAWTAFTTTLSAIWQGAVTAATTVWNVLSTFFTTLWNGIVAVATAVWSTFGGSLTTIWNGIVQIATGVWNMLKAVIMGPILIVIDLLTANWTQLGADLQLIWNSIVSAAGQIWNGLVTYFSGIWSLIQTYAMTVWNTLVSTLEGLWNGAVSAASAIWSALSSFFSGLWSGIVSTTEGVWNSVVSFLSGLWSGTVSTAEGIWNALPGFFSGLWNSITSFFSSAWNNIKSIVIGAATSIFNGAKAVWSGFTGMVSGIVNGIKGAFNALRNFSLADAGRAIMDSFFNGLKSAWGKITDFVGGIASWIRKHKGPISYDAKLLIPAGNAIMNGLNAGLTDKFSDVQRNVSSMAQAIADSAAVTMPAVNTSPFDASLQSLNNSVQGATLSSNLDVNYTRKQTIEVPLYIDGREVARATANPMQTELNRLTKISNYRKGLV